MNVHSSYLDTQEWFHIRFIASFYPTSEKKVKSCVNSLKSDMFKMQNTCYSLFKFCLISQQQWENSGKHLSFPSGVVVGSICQPFFLLKYCTCSRLFVSSDGEGRMLIRATALPLGPLQAFIQGFSWHWLGSEWKMCYCQKSSELMDSPNTEEQKYTQRKEEELLVQHGFNCCVCV